jgi:hypothetical protein
MKIPDVLIEIRGGTLIEISVLQGRSNLDIMVIDYDDLRDTELDRGSVEFYSGATEESQDGMLRKIQAVDDSF